MTNIRMSIDVNPDFHKAIKAHAALHSETVREYVIEAIMDRVRKEKVFNEMTVRTLEKSAKGLDLKRYKSMKELYKDLGI